MLTSHKRILVLIAFVCLFFPRPGLAAATYTFAPANGTLEVNDALSLTVLLQSGGDAINAGDATISFPADMLQVTSIAKGSLFSYWPEDPSFSNTTGTITFAGGLPDPGFSSSDGQTIVINFSAVADGAAEVCTTAGSILKNDGSGTNIFSGFSCATFTIHPASLPAAPSVTSPTHPDQNETYDTTDPQFSWTTDAGVTGFSYILDQTENTIPDDTSEGTDETVSYTDLADGVWYFHIKAQNENGWGATTHFKVQIDTEAPPVPSAPAVSSSTHPDQDAWYQDTNPSFSWTTDAGVTGFSYILDQTENTIPDDTSEGTDETVSYTDLADGVWYFHIKAQNENGWGAVTTFVIQIDTTPPTISGSVEGAPETKDTTPDLTIIADDAISGVESVEVFIDGVSFGVFSMSELTDPLTLPVLATGEHEIRLVAFDAAGNSAEALLSILIKQPTIIEQITDTITDVIPESIKEVARNIGEGVTRVVNEIAAPIQEVVEQLRNIEEVVDVTEELAEPISRAAAAIGVATAAATLPAGIINALFAFLRFGYLFISPFFARRRGKPWGTVLDSFTGKPIKGAIVRIFETEFNKMKESQITDELGRFGFLVDPGTYTVSVEKLGYEFPSRLTHADLSVTEIYTGGEIVVDDEKNPNITVSIPIDPITEHMSESKIAWKRVRDAFAVFLERINWPLLVIGTGVSLWTAFIVPDILNTLILLLYVLLIVLKFVQRKLTFKSYGTVLDAETKAPLGLAVIRIFNAETSTMITTRITNQSGKFSALVRPGTYYLMVTKPPYQPAKTEPVKLSKTETLSMNIELTKNTSQPPIAPPTPPPIASAEPTSKNPAVTPQEAKEATKAVSTPPVPPPLAGTDDTTKTSSKQPKE